MIRERRINSGRVPTIVIARKRGIGKKSGLIFFLVADFILRFAATGDFIEMGFFGLDTADFEVAELLEPLLVLILFLLITLGTKHLRYQRQFL
jgi:hypothetical protein